MSRHVIPREIAAQVHVLPREMVAQMKCDTRKVRWQSCISNAGVGEVVHLKVGNRTWVHSE